MEELEKEHFDKFGVYPNIIGLFWNDQEAVMDGIEDAIEDGKPYDEYLMLDDEQKQLFDNGRILF
jgi:hypothetical protein